MTIPVDYLVVAGGGGGGSAVSGSAAGMGGGAGGLRTATAYAAATGTPLTVTVGSGGASDVSGSDSVFDTITSIGGGRGSVGGTNGGSGGGRIYSVTAPGGLGTAGQGYDGGAGSGNHLGGTYYPSGGGGGAGGVGGNGNNNNTGGTGGPGVSSSLSGAAVVYAGGGGGACYGGGTPGYGDLGGGGGGGGGYPGTTGIAGTNGLGGGGGGGGSPNWPGSAGGSGIVILRYADTYPAASATTGSPTYSASGGYRTYTWTTVGTWSITLDAGTAINETISESVAAGFSLTSTWIFANTIAESVTLAANLASPQTYYDTHSASILSGFSFVEYDDTTRLLLKFNEVNGSTTPIDKSSYGWLRTVTTGTGAVSSAQGRFGTNSIAVGNPTGAKDLAAFTTVSGVNDLFQYDGSVNKQFDIWFRPINTNSHTIFSVELNNGHYLVLYYSAGTTYAYYSDAANTVGIYVVASFAETITANVWAHYRVALNGNTIRVGKDGVDKASASLSENIWRGQVKAGTPPIPSGVRVGRFPAAYDANSGYDYLVAQGYADSFVITEGAGVWTGGAYAVPLNEPADTWYRESDNVIGLYLGDAFDVGVGSTLAATFTLNNSLPVTVAMGYSLSVTGGTIGFDEALAFGLTLNSVFASLGTFNDAVANTVVMSDAMLATKTYTDTHTGSVALGYALAQSAIFPVSVAESVALAASWGTAPTYTLSFSESLALGMAAGTTQIHQSAVPFPVALFFRAIDLSATEASNSYVLQTVSESMVLTDL